ncbi:MAG: amidohydrolase family protein [Gemmatimonadales bacterium]
MVPVALAALALLQANATQAQPREPVYVIRNVSVIATTGAPTRTWDVVVRGRTIAQLLPANAAQVAGATVIEGTGKYLIPGLIDTHVHLKQEDPLLLFVVNGVTTVQNMNGQPWHLERRQQTAQGTLLGPRILTTGPTTARVGVPGPDDAEKLVREQKAAGYDAIKMYGSDGSGDMTLETYRRLITVAHALGLRVVGHAPRNLPFQVVLDEDQNSIDHMEEIVYTHRPFARLLQPYIDVQFGRATTEVRDSLARTPVPDFAAELRGEIDALARAVKASGLAVTPNLVYFRNIQWMTTDSIHALLGGTELAYAAPGQRLNWSPLLNRYRTAWRGTRDLVSSYLGRAVELEYAMTAAFHRAGVPLMTGTDSEGLGAQPGFGLHTELELLVHCGLSPLDALRSATSVPARELRIADSVGSVEPGKVADLVLLDADPLADIGHVRRITGVMRAGQWIPQSAAKAMLDSLAASYAPVQAELAAFVQALEQRGAKAALETYAASPEKAAIAKPVEQVINAWGYRVMGEGRVPEAIEVFTLNTEAFPREYNTWDSLAEAWMNAGRNDLAIQYYRKVLELHPGDENATRMLNQLGVSP